MSEMLIEARAVDKAYGGAGRQVEILRGLDLAVDAGEIVAVVGASGVGKSTLLHLLGALDQPDRGSLRFRGEEMTGWSAGRRCRYRRRDVAFVFQQHHLLPEFDVLENTLVPARLRREHGSEVWRRARELLDAVGLADRMHHRPAELSLGEQQRASVARALVGRPSLVLADEPTGSLDPGTGERVFSLLGELQRTHGFSAVVVTHNGKLARRCDRILELNEGRLHERSHSPGSVVDGVSPDSGAANARL